MIDTRVDDVVLQVEEEWTLYRRENMPKRERREYDQKLNLKLSSCGVATKIDFCCPTCSDPAATVDTLPSKFHGTKIEGKRSATNRLTWHQLNIRMVLAALAMGVGGIDVEIFLGLLGLPAARSFHQSFGVIEKEIGMYIRDIVQKALDEALKEEIEATLDQELEEWNDMTESSALIWAGRREVPAIDVTPSQDMPSPSVSAPRRSSTSSSAARHALNASSQRKRRNPLPTMNARATTRGVQKGWKAQQR